MASVPPGLLVCTILVLGPFGGGSAHGTTVMLGLRPSAGWSSCDSPVGIKILNQFVVEQKKT